MIESKCTNSFFNFEFSRDVLRKSQSSYFGLKNYSEALELQQKTVDKVKEQSQIIILGGEHPEVMTLGLRAQNKTHLELGIQGWPYSIESIRRGGLATIHTPGQLVIYPICDLKDLNVSVKDFVHLLFYCTQQTLLTYGIESEIDLCSQPGIYVDEKKIAFCGLQISHGLTMHGLSINIHNDLNLFKYLTPCGIQNLQLTSMKELEINVSTQDFFNNWILQLKLI